MSALPADALSYRPMSVDDALAVHAIEKEIYAFPWTPGNFVDSVQAGYLCTILELNGVLVGYGVLSVAAGESHLLNLSIAQPWQRRGLGRALLLHHIDLARAHNAGVLLLEVRPSNAAARALYAAFGFATVGLRRGYYPDAGGREDALLLALDL